MFAIKTNRYALVLLVATAILLVYSIVSTSVYWIEPTALGLASELPLAYWLGLAILCCLWFVGRHSKYFLAVCLALTFLYLYVAPTLIRVPVWISNSYYPFGESKLINQFGHIYYRPGAPSNTLVSYLDWPAFLCFASEFTLVTGIPDYVILKLFPLLVVALYGLFLILIQRMKLGFWPAVFGGALLLGGFFIRQDYYGPQAISYVLFLMGVLLVSWLFFDEKAHKRTLALLLIFLFTVTTLIHPLTSLMLLVTMISVLITYRFFLKKSTGAALVLCLISAFVWVGYQLYNASLFFDATIRSLLNLVLGTTKPNIVSSSGRPLGSEAMEVNFIASYLIVGLFAGIAVLLVLSKSRRLWKRKTPLTKDQGYLIFNVILLVMMALFAFGGEYGATEAYQRAFFFGLVPLTYLCVNLLKSKLTLLVIFLIVIIFLNIPAQYGSDNYRLSTNSILTGTSFLTSYSPGNFSIVGSDTLYIRYYNPLINYTVPDVGLDYPFTSLHNSSAVDEAINRVLQQVNYVERSNVEDNYYIFYLGYNPFATTSFDAGCDHVYDNGGFVLYAPVNFT